jgi:hypothetical protein
MEWHPDWFDMGRAGFIEAVKERSKALGQKLSSPSNFELKEKKKK